MTPASRALKTSRKLTKLVSPALYTRPEEKPSLAVNKKDLAVTLLNPLHFDEGPGREGFSCYSFKVVDTSDLWEENFVKGNTVRKGFRITGSSTK